METEDPRAYTAEEVRDNILGHMRMTARYWASSKIERTTLERIEGALFSVLAMLDGDAIGLPAFDIVARPHPEDKAYHQSMGTNWFQDGTVIPGALHEHWYQTEKP